MIYAIDYRLGHETRTIVVRALDADDAFFEARDQLRERRLTSAALLGSPRIATIDDIDRADGPP